MQKAPLQWPTIYDEARGFNLLLALFFDAQLRWASPGQEWAHRFAALARAALGERPCMGSWSAAAIAHEFSWEALLARAADGAPLVEGYFQSLPGATPVWWRDSERPRSLEIHHGYLSMMTLWRDDRPQSPWTERGGAIDCALDLFSQGCDGRSFSPGEAGAFAWAQGWIEARRLRQAMDGLAQPGACGENARL